jgi:GT2 family glycosyltransferase
VVNAIVLSFNHPNLTKQSVAAAFEAFPHSTTLVHNGSHQSNVMDLSATFPAVKHEIMTTNKGYSGGVNYGIKNSFADWILLLTNDCDLKQFSVNMESLREDTVYVPSIYFRGLKRVDSFGGCVQLKFGKLLHCKTQNHFQSLYLNPANMEFPYVPGSAFLVSKKLFFDSGGFDEELFTYWEDVDWSLRLLQRGFKLSLHTGIVIEHGGGKTCRKDPLYTNYYFQRNKRIVCRKWIKQLSRNPVDLITLESNLLRESVLGFLKSSASKKSPNSKNEFLHRKQYDVVRSSFPTKHE